MFGCRDAAQPIRLPLKLDLRVGRLRNTGDDMKLVGRVAAAIGIAASSIALAGCQEAGLTKSKPPAYEISKDGIVVETGKNVYQSLGDVTFRRTQNFKVRRNGDDASKVNTVLIAKVVVKVGGKDVSENYNSIVVDRGEGKLDCDHFYDVKLAKFDEAPDPVCTITVLGEVNIAPATATIK